MCGRVSCPGACRPGCRRAAYAELGVDGGGGRVPALLDAHGEALLQGAPPGPAIVKPNLAELEPA